MRVELDQQGMVMAVMAVCLLLFLAIVAFVVDLGHGLSVKTQLQEVADAAALASSAHLDGTLAGIDAARAEAMAYAAKNQANGAPVALSAGDIEFGYWDMPTKVFNPILPGNLGYPEDINAVRITARRDTANGTALSTTFAKTFGRNTMDVSAQAVAERGGPSQCVDSDDPELDCNLDIPLVLCKDKIVHEEGNPFCGVEITVGDTPTQVGALTSYYDTTNTGNILDYINGTKENPTLYARPCSQCPLGAGIQITQGVLTPIFDALKAKYDEKVAPCLSGSDGPSCEDANEDGAWEWKTFVSVACINCDDPDMTSGPACVTGFARMNVEEVCVPSQPCMHQGGATGQKALYGFLKCGEDSSPLSGVGGTNFGTLSPIPGLVQ